MAFNLIKAQLSVAGHDLARRYLIRNIRVEQSHVDFWAHPIASRLFKKL